MAKFQYRTLFISVLLPSVAGCIAASFSSLDFWFGMKEGLIAFLGFLAASIIQVMVVTANFLQADKLNPAEALRLSKELTRQQHFWIALLYATIFALIIIIVGAALKDVVKPVIYFPEENYKFEISWPAVVVFFMASAFCFVFYRMFALLDGVLSLHNLRAELVMAAAQREADEKAIALQEAARQERRIVPSDYGKILPPPKI